jgi:hypothetical protein
VGLTNAGVSKRVRAALGRAVTLPSPGSVTGDNAALPIFAISTS